MTRWNESGIATVIVTLTVNGIEIGDGHDVLGRSRTRMSPMGCDSFVAGLGSDDVAEYDLYCHLDLTSESTVFAWCFLILARVLNVGLEEEKLIGGMRTSRRWKCGAFCLAHIPLGPWRCGCKLDLWQLGLRHGMKMVDKGG